MPAIAGAKKQKTTLKSKEEMAEDAKDESVSSNIKKICYERGIFKSDGFLDP